MDFLRFHWKFPNHAYGRNLNSPLSNTPNDCLFYFLYSKCKSYVQWETQLWLKSFETLIVFKRSQYVSNFYLHIKQEIEVKKSWNKYFKTNFTWTGGRSIGRVSYIFQSIVLRHCFDSPFRLNTGWIWNWIFLYIFKKIILHTFAHLTEPFFRLKAKLLPNK